MSPCCAPGITPRRLFYNDRLLIIRTRGAERAIAFYMIADSGDALQTPLRRFFSIMLAWHTIAALPLCRGRRLKIRRRAARLTQLITTSAAA